MTDGELHRCRAPLCEWVVAWLAKWHMAVGAGAAVTGPVVAVFASQNGGSWRVPGVIGTAALALVGFAVPAARSKQKEIELAEAEERTRRVEAVMRVAISDIFLPVLSHMRNALDPLSPRTLKEARAEIIPIVLLNVVRLCGRADRCRTRASYYALVDESGRQTFRPRGHYGRGEQPSTTFSDSEPRGRALLDLLDREGTELWSDLNDAKPRDWKPSGSTTYRSCMIVPVRTDTRGFGLIMVDAGEPNLLREEDLCVVKMFAAMLALVFAQIRNTDTAIPVTSPTQT